MLIVQKGGPKEPRSRSEPEAKRILFTKKGCLVSISEGRGEQTETERVEHCKGLGIERADKANLERQKG